MYSPWVLIVACTLISWRLTRALTKDRIGQPVRALAGPRWTAFASCPACAGFWICVVVFGAACVYQSAGHPTMVEGVVWFAAACGANFAQATAVDVYETAVDAYSAAHGIEPIPEGGDGE